MKTEIICHDPKCEECGDREWLKDFLEVDELIVKKTTGKGGIVHNDIIKYNEIMEEKHKLMADEAKKIYDKTLKDVKFAVKKLGEMWEEAEVNNHKLDALEKKYPICKRIWRGEEEPHLKVNYHEGKILDLQDDLVEKLKEIYD